MASIVGFKWKTNVRNEDAWQPTKFACGFRLVLGSPTMY